MTNKYSCIWILIEYNNNNEVAHSEDPLELSEEEPEKPVKQADRELKGTAILCFCQKHVFLEELELLIV